MPLPVTPERTRLTPGRRFQLCGAAGLLLALASGMLLASRLALSFWVVASMWLVAIATFLALAMATKIIVGQERLIYYHHEIAVTLTVAVTLTIAGQPRLRYLDILVCGLGIFLACGRIGCLQAACCHGRPAQSGIRYGAGHVRAGLPPFLQGVKLLPVQAIESAAVTILSCMAIGAVWAGSTAGIAFSLYVAGYAMLRFGFEFLRGDAGRPYWRGFSEAQWTSLVVALWVPPVAFSIALAMAIVAMVRRAHPARAMLHADHIEEVATALEVPPQAGGIAMATTSLGLRISSGHAWEEGRWIRHFTISCTTMPLDDGTAQDLKLLIERLTGARQPARLVTGGSKSVFHVLLEAHANSR